MKIKLFYCQIIQHDQVNYQVVNFSVKKETLKLLYSPPTQNITLCISNKPGMYIVTV